MDWSAGSLVLQRLMTSRNWRLFLSVRRFVLKKPLGALGAAIVIFVVVMALLADHVAPYDPLKSQPDALFLAPSARHFFGTDNVGRDVLSRVIHGARISLWVGVASVTLGTTLATIVGLVSGFAGGRVDILIQRVIDLFMAFPGLVLLLMIVAVFGAGMRNVILSISLFLAFAPSRVIRGAVLAEREKQYVEAARTLGASELRILFRHVLPNVVPIVIVSASIAIGTAILSEASLSFLGLGVPPPAVSWGRMIGGDARAFFLVAPWLALFPGLALSLTVFGFNMLGDALRDVLDPQLRSR